MIIALLWLIIFCISVSSMEGTERFEKQWEQRATEEFLEQLCKEGTCSYSTFITYHMAMNYAGLVSELRVEEYRKEQDYENKIYYYLVTWEVISESLMNSGSYRFEEGSVIKVSIHRQGRIGSAKMQYYDIVTGKE